MTTATTLTGFDPALLGFLDEHDVRYEVIDGSIVVSPPSGTRHEHLVIRIGRHLDTAAAPDVGVFGSNFGYYYEPGSFVMADVTVARWQDCDEGGTLAPPLLVVEILSKSTRRRDLNRKREIYEETGVPSYWVVDPEASTITVLELKDGSYREVLTSPLDQPFTVERPFSLTLTVLPDKR